MATPFYSHNEIMGAMLLDKMGDGETFTMITRYPERFYTFACGKGQTYLFKACKYTLRAVQFFLLHCDVNARDEVGRTILWNIIYRDTIEILEYVLPRMSTEAIATQDRYGDTVLHIAKKSMPSALPLLLNYVTEDTQGKKNLHGEVYTEDRPLTRGAMYPMLGKLKQASCQYTRNPMQPSFKTAHIPQMTGRSSRVSSSSERETDVYISFEEQVARAFYSLPQGVRDGERGLGMNDLPSDPMVAQCVMSVLASLGIERCKKKIAELSSSSSSSE